MEKYLEKRQQILQISLLVIGIVCLVSALLLALNRYTSTSEIARKSHEYLEATVPEANASDYQTKFIYIPSPIEIYLLKNRSEVWPKFFNRHKPLSVDMIPDFYSLLRNGLSEPEVSRNEIVQVRAWSVSLNTLAFDRLVFLLGGQGSRWNPKTFAEALNVGFASSAETCSLLKQERAFRIAQLWQGKFAAEAQEYIRSCDSDGILRHWFDLLDVVQKKNAKSLEAQIVNLRILALQAQDTFQDWFYTQILAFAELTLENWVHSQKM